MSLAEGVSGRLSYKAYASGEITPNALAVSSTDLGASDAQILRRVSNPLKLSKDTYQSNEVRFDRQIVDFRHGVKRVTGQFSGELSPGTYFPLFEAALRGTATDVAALSESELTSVAADSGSSKLTFGGGDPVALGLRVGHIVRFANLSESTNNGKNFLITGIGGSNNREVTVYPAPTTMSADTDFDMTVQGKSVIIPSSGHVKRKFGFEVYNEDIDVARLYTECRVGGFTINLPASGNSTTDFPVMGRDMEVYDGGDAPFFTSPAAESTTGTLQAVNGLLRVGGTAVGVVTGLNIQMALNPSSDPVVGQNFVPEIFLGRANSTGQLTAMLQDGYFLNAFKNEEEIDVLAFLTSNNNDTSPAISIHLPRIKLGDAAPSDSGEGGQTITCPFQALKYTGSAPGVDQTTIRITDSEAE